MIKQLAILFLITVICISATACDEYYHEKTIDINITLDSDATVYEIMEYIEDYPKSSGLECRGVQIKYYTNKSLHVYYQNRWKELDYEVSLETNTLLQVTEIRGSSKAFKGSGLNVEWKHWHEDPNEVKSFLNEKYDTNIRMVDLFSDTWNFYDGDRTIVYDVINKQVVSEH